MFFTFYANNMFSKTYFCMHTHIYKARNMFFYFLAAMCSKYRRYCDKLSFLKSFCAVSCNSCSKKWKRPWLGEYKCRWMYTNICKIKATNIDDLWLNTCLSLCKILKKKVEIYCAKQNICFYFYLVFNLINFIDQSSFPQNNKIFIYYLPFMFTIWDQNIWTFS